MTKPRIQVVYQLETSGRLLRDRPWLIDDRAELLTFLHAHGLRMRFAMGTTIDVRLREADDTLWVHTRRMTGEAPDGVEMCPHCDGCVKTEEWVTPLVAAVPYVERAYVLDGYLDRLIDLDCGV